MDRKPPVIQKLILKRFRSIPLARLEFDNPMFIVGQNGSGKSNLADAFAFLAESMTAPLQAVFDNRGGISSVRNRSSGSSYPPNLGIAVTFGALDETVTSGHYAFEIVARPDYGFEVKREQCIVRSVTGGRAYYDRTNQAFTSSVPGLNPAVERSALCLPLVGGDVRFAPVLHTLSRMRVYSIEPAKLRTFQEPESASSLRRDGSNAASVLSDIGRQSTDDLQDVKEALGTIVPGTTGVESVKHANKLLLRFAQEWKERGKGKKLNFEAHNMSDGTLRALGIILSVYQSQAPSLMVIEEPEATIHPGALGAILDLIHTASGRMQVLVTTHSPELLNAAKWIDDRHLRVVTWKDGATRITAIDEAARKALEEHLMGAGELLASNVLRPREAELFRRLPAGQMDLFEPLQ
ncbi:MAG: AAA family ATPase [Polyangiaceae bacterium]